MRIRALLLSSVCILGVFSGCGSEESSPEPAPAAPTRVAPTKNAKSLAPNAPLNEMQKPQSL